MRIRPLALVSASAATLLLAGCGGSSGSASSSAPASGSATPTAAAPASVAASSSAPEKSDAGVTTGAAAGKPVTVNKSFSDPVLGEKGTVLKYLRGYTPSEAARNKYSALVDEEVILVEVKVTASSKYYDSFGADSFTLTGGSNGIDESSTTILDDEVQTAGYPPLKDADTGKTETGWIVFTPKKGDITSLTLRFTRLAATTSGGKSIPKKNFDIPLAG